MKKSIKTLTLALAACLAYNESISAMGAGAIRQAGSKAAAMLRQPIAQALPQQLGGAARQLSSGVKTLQAESFITPYEKSMLEYYESIIKYVEKEQINNPLMSQKERMILNDLYQKVMRDYTTTKRDVDYAINKRAQEAYFGSSHDIASPQTARGIIQSVTPQTAPKELLPPMGRPDLYPAAEGRLEAHDILAKQTHGETIYNPYAKKSYKDLLKDLAKKRNEQAIQTYNISPY